MCSSKAEFILHMRHMAPRLGHLLSFIQEGNHQCYPRRPPCHTRLISYMHTCKYLAKKIDKLNAGKAPGTFESFMRPCRHQIDPVSAASVRRNDAATLPTSSREELPGQLVGLSFEAELARAKRPVGAESALVGAAVPHNPAAADEAPVLPGAFELHNI